MSYVREGMLPVYHVTDDGKKTRCGLDVLDTDVQLVTVCDDVRRCVACMTVATAQEQRDVIQAQDAQNERQARHEQIIQTWKRGVRR